MTVAIFRARASILPRVTSIVTATMMTEPITMYWMSLPALNRFSPLRMAEMRRAPSSVPQMVPLPPWNDAPPMMHAAMASVS